MNESGIRILDGSTFVVAGSNGDLDPSNKFPTGLFSFDTRFLSTWQLRIDGEEMTALSVDDVHYFEARFFLVPGGATHYVDAKISVIRQQTVGGSFDESLTVLNLGGESTDLNVRVDAASDFADLFEIKDVGAKRGTSYTRLEGDRLRLGYVRDTFRRETVISSSHPADMDEKGLTFRIHLGPHASWTTELRVQMLGADGRDIRSNLQGEPERGRTALHRELGEWLAEAPELVCDSKILSEAYQRTLVDLAALRYTTLQFGRTLPAAGLPWFMAVFGRDSLLTSLQALPFVPELAATTLRVLASLQGSRQDDFREEEPGKILHEARSGESAAFEEQPHSPYYGSADATPLFLILLDEYERWTGDQDLVRSMEPFARAALTWIDEYGDLMGNGYLSYQRRNEDTGLENQCWKDSWDAISHEDGSLPAFPRATCELQGYVYDAKKRSARLARSFWGDSQYARRLDSEADDLKERFNRDFWLSDKGYYALALGGDGRPTEVLSSNIGHLLWSGIVNADRAQRIVDLLMGPRLFSGWGVRTLAEGESRYNALGYHVGTVWPFDNSFIAWGLRRYGFAAEAARIAEAMIDASEFFQGRLPEAFAGFDRNLTSYPVEYPTACSPQAWSAGVPLLLLRTMLGIDAHEDHLQVDPVLPKSIKRIDLLDIPGRWGRADAFGRARPIGRRRDRSAATVAEDIDGTP
ncbi:amylo-alpha-1,6-glucosidase [Micromonospora sp. NBC_00362]|uniref:amylo-alpha-1,6-glucosidase n=1 Tax=Micromonospora sp. NBC_00362 TaxID=2975975 RepID=UPI00224D18D5|nr:glycogen debranching N-terminal domain-containing protein [Micromonospora sp. NBC_00362]MCX5121795.1 amylo-alpha-1,6-glucosidase [Micromonospora sp. NBC_00362]